MNCPHRAQGCCPYPIIEGPTELLCRQGPPVVHITVPFIVVDLDRRIAQEVRLTEELLRARAPDAGEVLSWDEELYRALTHLLRPGVVLLSEGFVGLAAILHDRCPHIEWITEIENRPRERHREAYLTWYAILGSEYDDPALWELPRCVRHLRWRLGVAGIEQLVVGCATGVSISSSSDSDSGSGAALSSCDVGGALTSLSS